MVPTPTYIYHMTHLGNLPGILQAGGLLPHRRLRGGGLPYTDIAHHRVQDRRAQTGVPCGPGGDLHDYIPFYFAPRSPMLYVISRGGVEGYDGSQQPVVHLVSTVAVVAEAGIGYVFTDGHAIMAWTEFHTDPARLDAVDWDVMSAQYWADTNEDPDRKRRRQAEFLVHGFCPWRLVTEIGVMDAGAQDQVTVLLARAGHCTPTIVHRDWYY